MPVRVDLVIEQLVEAINRDPRYLLFLPDAFPHGPLAFEGSCSDQSEAASKCLHALVNLYSGQQKQRTGKSVEPISSLNLLFSRY